MGMGGGGRLPGCDPDRQRQSGNHGLTGGFFPFGSKPPDKRKLEAARDYMDKNCEEEKKKVNIPLKILTSKIVF